MAPASADDNSRAQSAATSIAAETGPAPSGVTGVTRPLLLHPKRLQNDDARDKRAIIHGGKI